MSNITLDEKIGAGFLLTIIINLVSLGVVYGKLATRQEANTNLLAEHDKTIKAHEESVIAFKSFAAVGPRFSSADAKNLKNEAVSDAVSIATQQNKELGSKLDLLSDQLIELKLILARQGAK